MFPRIEELVPSRALRGGDVPDLAPCKFCGRCLAWACRPVRCCRATCYRRPRNAAGRRGAAECSSSTLPPGSREDGGLVLGLRALRVANVTLRPDRADLGTGIKRVPVGSWSVEPFAQVAYRELPRHLI